MRDALRCIVVKKGHFTHYHLIELIMKGAPHEKEAESCVKSIIIARALII